MTKRRIKMLKKSVITALAAGIAVIAIAIVCLRRPKDINAVTDGRFASVEQINSSQDAVSTDEFCNFLKKQKFVSCNGTDLGNTARISYKCYDKNGNLLFTFTDIGNKDLCQITVNGKTSTYVMKQKHN